MHENTSAEARLPSRTTLRDGRRVVLRQILAQDKAGLLAAFHRLSDDSRYTRFMASMRELPDAMLESATHPVAGREFALVAVSDDGEAGTIVGGARYAAGPGSDTCEFAITVADDWHGVGLAKCLMHSLIAVARAAGYRNMEGYVLASNTSMRRLARGLGFVDTACPEDSTLRVVVLGLTEEPGAA
jgi:L-amino acid N-acyltransferase YncA